MGAQGGMKKTKLFILVVPLLAVGLVALLLIPSGPQRYDTSPAGIDARKIDEHIERARTWHPPNVREARDMLGPQQDPKRYIMLRHMDYLETKAFVNELYAAGAPEVGFANIRHHHGRGDAPEGMFVTLPDDPTVRGAIFTVAGKWYTRAGQATPPDLKQKCLYFGYGTWSPSDPEPGLLY
jgi:hypothetical protein